MKTAAGGKLKQFLAALMERPEDEDTRLVFADWLSERDDDLEAVFRAPPPDGKVNLLSKPQQRLFGSVRDHWLAVGLATGPTDEARANQEVSEAYKVAGLIPPAIFVWFDSPLRGAIAAELFRNKLWNQVGDQVRNQVRAQVWAQVGAHVWAHVGDQVWDQVGDQVWDQVGDQVWDQVRDQVWDQVWDQVGDQVWDQVWDQVGDQVGDQVRDQVRDQVGDQVYRCGYGQHDAAWLAFYAYLELACRINVPRLYPMMRLAHLCGWWWPFEGVCVLTRRPSVCEMQDSKLVRVVYPDGWEVPAKGKG